MICFTFIWTLWAIPNLSGRNPWGVKFDSNNSMNSHVASIASRIGLNFQQLKPFLKHANMQQRKTIMRSKLESIALYASPLLFNESQSCTKRLESVIMTIYKWIYNRCTYRKKYSDICKEIKIEEPSQTLLKNNAKFICKIMYEKKVDHLTNLMIINPWIGTKIYLVDPQKQQSKSAIIRLVHLYNALPLELKTFNPQRLKRRLSRLDISFKDWKVEAQRTQYTVQVKPTHTSPKLTPVETKFTSSTHSVTNLINT